MSSYVEALKQKYTISVEGRPSLSAILKDGDETVSNEGFLGNLYGDYMRNRQFGKKPDIVKIKESQRKLREAVKMFYANPAWVAKRRFVEGDVSIHGIAALVQDYSIATPEQISKNLDILNSWNEKLLAAAEDTAKQLGEVGSRLKSADINDETLLRFQSATNDVPTFGSKTIPMLEKDFLLPMGYRIYNQGVTEPQRTNIKKLPALNPEQLQIVAGLLLRCVEESEEYDNKIDAICGDDNISFAKNPQWRGWKVINTYNRNHDTASLNEDIDFGNEIGNSIYRIGRGIAKAGIVAKERSDKERYTAWRQILSSYNGYLGVPQWTIWNVQTEIQRVLAAWIDASIR